MPLDHEEYKQAEAFRYVFKDLERQINPTKVYTCKTIGDFHRKPKSVEFKTEEQRKLLIETKDVYEREKKTFTKEELDKFGI